MGEYIYDSAQMAKILINFREQPRTVVTGLLITSERTGEENKRPAVCDDCGVKLGIGKGIRWAMSTGNGSVASYRHLCHECDATKTAATAKGREVYEKLMASNRLSQLTCLHMASAVEFAGANADKAAELILNGIENGERPTSISLYIHRYFSRWNNRD